MLLDSLIEDLIYQAKAYSNLKQYEKARPFMESLVAIAAADNHYALKNACEYVSHSLQKVSSRLALKFFHLRELEADYFDNGSGIRAFCRTLAINGIYQVAMLMDDPQEKRSYLAEVLMLSGAHLEARTALLILDGKLNAEDVVDPNHLPVQSTEIQKVSAERFVCPKCGSRMVFDGDGHALVCEACVRKETIEARVLNDNEQDFTVAMVTGKGLRKPVAMKTFRCLGCGADFLLPPQALSEICSYCGSVYVLVGTRELLEPDIIIPMAFNQREAAQRLVRWVKAHKIIPDGKVRAPRGLYLPVWTFDTTGTISWQVSLDYATFSDVNHTAFAEYSNLGVVATPNLKDLLHLTLNEFSFIGAPAYNSRYLAGWPAEIYQIPLGLASLTAREQAIECLRNERHHPPSLRYLTDKLAIQSFRLGLVPVWITEYPLKGRIFRIIINGQTGAVHGETPTRGILSRLENLLHKQIFIHQNGE